MYNELKSVCNENGINMDTDIIMNYIARNTDFKPLSIYVAGKGASACVYKVNTEENPYILAVKCSNNVDLLKQEYEQIKFISDRVDCKLPALYHFGEYSGGAIMILEHFDGVSADKIKSIKKAGKILPDMIADNLLKIHSVHNDKFGPVNHAVYDTWYQYYSEFAGEIYDFVKQAYSERKISKKVLRAVKLSYERLDKILCGSNGEPALIHGDYWQPNFIVNPYTYELVGIIDPFNIMWAEPEYELFALTVGGSKKLKLYENYKSRIVPTEYCDLKVEMYALYNELLWYKKLGSISKSYLRYRSGRLIKQMKRKGLL